MQKGHESTSVCWVPARWQENVLRLKVALGFKNVLSMDPGMRVVQLRSSLLRSQEDSQPTRKPSRKQSWQQGQQPPRQWCVRLRHFGNPVCVLRRGDCPPDTQAYAPSRFSALHSQAFQNPHAPEEITCQQIGQVLKEIVQLVPPRPFLERLLFKFERCKIWCRNYCEIIARSWV